MRTITQIAISGYRSLRDVTLSLDALNVVTGANGSGKSGLYRALRLLADIAQGRIIQSLAVEGGLVFALWAGPEPFSRAVKQGVHPVEGDWLRNPVSLKLGFSSEDYGYAIDLGLPIPPPSPTWFARDPVIKAESLWAGQALKRTRMSMPSGPGRRSESAAGPARGDKPFMISRPSTACLPIAAIRAKRRNCSGCASGCATGASTIISAPTPRRRPAGARSARARRCSPATAPISPRRLRRSRKSAASKRSDAAVADAFPGGSIAIADTDGYFELEMRQHGLLRPLRAAELSDGTLRYLLLTAALLSPRPPELMILNEPETSLHPDLLPPLARLIARASRALTDRRRLACTEPGGRPERGRGKRDRPGKATRRDTGGRRRSAAVALARAIGETGFRLSK